MFLFLFISLAGGGRILGPLVNLIPLAIVAAPWIFAALFLWHWGAAILFELRGIRAALRKISAALEQEPRPHPNRER
jgi:hypothetical protein